MDYKTFLKNKEVVSTPIGIESNGLNPALFDFQHDIVKWALKRGRAAIFADCGMGKTPMQLEWAKHIPGKVLILAPLAVAEQTVREGKKFCIDVKYRRYGGEDAEQITITNYEMMEKFNPSAYKGIVLDESSILKAQDGKTRKAIIDAFSKTDYRLACTATPAPNDYMELGNHAEFLGIMSMQEMLSMFFVHDGGEVQKWRLKGHAQDVFWKWMASWSVMIKKPSDLGYSDSKFVLPPLNLHEHVVQSTKMGEFLFPMQAATLQERIGARRDSTSERVSELVKVVRKTPGQWLIWCNLNKESEAITKALDAIQVTGSDTPEYKAATVMEFIEGKIRVLVSKPSIIGFGMNLQNCHNVAFLGLSDSYEQFYQAVRRCWRFGQTDPVDCHIVIANTEGAVLSNIKRKESDAERMAKNMVEHMKDLMKEEIKGAEHAIAEFKTGAESGESWNLFLGDCVDMSKDIPSDSIHYTIFSPPFASLYTYSNSPRDMGNCKTHGEFYEHFKFLVSELMRVTMPGRLVSFHCMNLPTSKQNHGYIGISDFRGDLIRMFQEVGFIYHSEVCIWKDPVTAMQRTKALGLLHKQIKKDSCMSRQGIPDYLVTMRKPGENHERVSHTNDSFPVQLWQRYASPVWMDINPSDTITFREARENQDERHICPLQLQVIERGIELWSNPGDTVFSPFAGVGSEGYQAVRQGRKYLGIELKKSYFDQAVKNLKSAKSQEMLLI